MYRQISESDSVRLWVPWISVTRSLLAGRPTRGSYGFYIFEEWNYRIDKNSWFWYLLVLEFIHHQPALHDSTRLNPVCDLDSGRQGEQNLLYMWINLKASSTRVYSRSQPCPCSSQIPAFLCSLSTPRCSQQFARKPCPHTSALCKKAFRPERPQKKNVCQRYTYGPEVQQSPTYPSSPPQTCHTDFQHSLHILPFMYCYTGKIWLAQHNSFSHASLHVLSSWVLPWVPWTFCEPSAPGFMGTIKISMWFLGFIATEKTPHINMI